MSSLILVYFHKAQHYLEDFQPIQLDDAKLAFEKLRNGEDSAPFKMSSHKKPFMEFFSSFTALEKHYDSGFIEETLSQVWTEFVEEYAMIETPDLDPKYSKYVLID